MTRNLKLSSITRRNKAERNVSKYEKYTKYGEDLLDDHERYEDVDDLLAGDENVGGATSKKLSHQTATGPKRRVRKVGLRRLPFNGRLAAPLSVPARLARAAVVDRSDPAHPAAVSKVLTYLLSAIDRKARLAASRRVKYVYPGRDRLQGFVHAAKTVYTAMPQQGPTATQLLALRTLKREFFRLLNVAHSSRQPPVGPGARARRRATRAPTPKLTARERRRLARSQLNGSNGEATGSDDTSCIYGRGNHQDVNIPVVIIRRPWPTPLTVKRGHWSRETTDFADSLVVPPLPADPACGSTLNGNNGEATNSDDTPGNGRKGNTRADKNQNVRLAAIERGLANLARARTQPQPAQPRQKPRAQPSSVPKQQRRAPRDSSVHPFIQAAIDPFVVKPSTVFAPTHPAHSTTKFTSTADIICTANAAGEACIFVTGTIVNDRDFLVVTNSSNPLTTGGVSTRPTTAHVGYNAVSHNSPLTTASLAVAGAGGTQPHQKSRILSIGVKVEYNGSADNRGGTAYALSLPDNSELSNATYQTTTDRAIGSRAHDLHQEHPIELVLVAGDKDHLDLSNNAYPISYGAGAAWWDYKSGVAHGGSAIGMIRISGATANATFRVTSILHGEVSGGPLACMATQNTIDNEVVDEHFATHSHATIAHHANPDLTRHKAATIHAAGNTSALALDMASKAGLPGAGALAALDRSATSTKGMRNLAMAASLFSRKR